MRNGKGQFIKGSIPANKKLLEFRVCVREGCDNVFQKVIKNPATKFCTHKCSTTATKGVPKPESQIQKMRDNNAHYWKGKKQSEKHITKATKALKPYQSGEKHWAWKGGITPIQRKLRFTKAYSDWRTAVFERDDYTCQQCARKGGRLNADHYPVSYAQLVGAQDWDGLSDINNGRTLCYECHIKTPNYGAKGQLRKIHAQS